jgi:hypothetical protein
MCDRPVSLQLHLVSWEARKSPTHPTSRGKSEHPGSAAIAGFPTLECTVPSWTRIIYLGTYECTTLFDKEEPASASVRGACQSSSESLQGTSLESHRPRTSQRPLNLRGICLSDSEEFCQFLRTGTGRSVHVMKRSPPTGQLG